MLPITGALVGIRQAAAVNSVVVKAVSGWQSLSVTINVEVVQTWVTWLPAPDMTLLVHWTKTSCVTTVFVQLEEDTADEDDTEEEDAEEDDAEEEDPFLLELSSFSSSSSFSRSSVRDFKVDMSSSTSSTAVSKPLSMSFVAWFKVLITHETSLIMSPTTLNGFGRPLFFLPPQLLPPGVGSPPSDSNKSSAAGRMPLMAETAASASDF